MGPSDAEPTRVAERWLRIERRKMVGLGERLLVDREVFWVDGG